MGLKIYKLAFIYLFMQDYCSSKGKAFLVLPKGRQSIDPERVCGGGVHRMVTCTRRRLLPKREDNEGLGIISSRREPLI